MSFIPYPRTVLAVIVAGGGWLLFALLVAADVSDEMAGWAGVFAILATVAVAGFAAGWTLRGRS